MSNVIQFADDLFHGFEKTKSPITGGTLYVVYYQLTKDAAIPSRSDHDDCVGRWFKSTLCIDHGEPKDSTYPYALQSDGSWLMCGRVVKDWAKVVMFPDPPTHEH